MQNFNKKKPKVISMGKTYAFSQFFYDRPVKVLVTILLITLSLIGLQITRLTSDIIVSQSVQNAKLLSETLTEFRTLYTKNVIARVRNSGVIVSHDFAEQEGAIPLPATLSMMLGNRFEERNEGMRARLYSPFPFPWRLEEGGLRDQFSVDAWNALTERPDCVFRGIRPPIPEYPATHDYWLRGLS